MAECPSGERLLLVRDVAKAFPSPDGGRLEVLRGVSFEVGSGETVAITGASGAGKSTLLYLLGGLEAADGGEVIFRGFDVTQARAGALARYHTSEVGFVFQASHLLPDLTAQENVALPLLIARNSFSESSDRAVAMLDRVGLGPRARHLPGRLSAGEQQRVALARALIAEPRMVLADEPTGNLDVATGALVGDALRSFASETRAAIVIATHNDDLARACDRRLVLREGRVSELNRDEQSTGAGNCRRIGL